MHLESSTDAADLPPVSPSVEVIATSDVSSPRDAPSAVMLAALGANPSACAVPAPALHEEVVVRWNTYLRHGLVKDVKQELSAKYPTPSNCPALSPPQLNGELLACLPADVLKQDTFYVKCQVQLAAGLTALGRPITRLLEVKEGDEEPPQEELISSLAESAQLLTNLFHTLSCHRRYLVLPNVKADFRKIIQDSPIDACLFGSGLQDKVRASQALQKTGKEMKALPPKIAGFQPQAGPSRVSQTLNSQFRQSRGRQKPPTGRTERPRTEGHRRSAQYRPKSSFRRHPSAPHRNQP